ncbi:MAG TPA: hypothetical protein DCZ94_20395 [Lentisphaeria bacterium]|nr:MAG: hypothetical protein A2X48_15225 [Lentisphaerae bacterium GWF2_49_21]HBC89308.1 hypothetical protein [Lentisphaeria bacterium]
MNTAEEVTVDKNKKGLLVDELAKLPEKTIMDEGKLASILKISTRTLRRLVQRAEIPPPISLGGRSVWLSDRILAYLNTSAEQAEKEALNQIKRISKYSP